MQSCSNSTQNPPPMNTTAWFNPPLFRIIHDFSSTGDPPPSPTNPSTDQSTHVPAAHAGDLHYSESSTTSPRQEIPNHPDGPRITAPWRPAVFHGGGGNPQWHDGSGAQYTAPVVNLFRMESVCHSVSHFCYYVVDWHWFDMKLIPHSPFDYCILHTCEYAVT